MKIKIIRQINESYGCFGMVSLEGSLETFFTLEPKDRFVEENSGSSKIDGLTAIPCGVYDGVLQKHKKFGECILIQNVPWFGDVFVRAGNTVKDTKADILIGKNKSLLSVNDSENALKKIIDIIRNKGKIVLEITRKY